MQGVGLLHQTLPSLKKMMAELTEEGSGGDDADTLGHHDGDAGLHEGHRKVHHSFSLRVDHQRCHHHVRLPVHQLRDQSVPLPVLDKSVQHYFTLKMAKGTTLVIQ